MYFSPKPLMVVKLLQNSLLSEKCYDPKTRPIRMQDFFKTDQLECRIFFKLQYATHELTHEVHFLYVIRHPITQQFYTAIATGYGQVSLDMHNVMPNNELAPSQK